MLRWAAQCPLAWHSCDATAVPSTPAPCHHRRALEVLQHAFPGRRVVAVPSRDILLGGGNIHCITQQQPAETAGSGSIG